MSGRPSRNCKRRSASEMLGKTKKASDTSSSPAKKVKVVEAKRVESPPKKSVAQKTSPRKSKQPKQVQPTVAESKKEAKLNLNREPTRTYSSRRKRTQKPDTEIEATDNAASSAAVADDDVERREQEVVEAVTETQDEEPIAEVSSAADVTNEEAIIADSPAVEAMNEVEHEEMEDSSIVVRSSGADFGGRSIVSKPTDVVKTVVSKQAMDNIEEVAVVEGSISAEEMESDALVIESLPEDGLTILEDGHDKNTLPERTDDFEESDLITLPTEAVEEVVMTDPSETARIAASKITYPKKKMMITANYKTLQAGLEQPSDQSRLGVVTADADQPPTMIPVVTMKPADSGLKTPRVYPKVAPLAEPVPPAPKPSPSKLPVTKTYIVGKNNTIQEVIMGKDNTVQEVISTDPVEVSPKLPAGDSDDEEFEYEDEEERLRQENLQQDEGVLFCENLMADYVVDELVMAVFQKIKSKDPFENHCTADDESGYKCNHCIEEGEVQESRGKLQMVRHLKEAHISDYAPWQCPICQFKCTYPGSLLLHMSMHTKNKPFECTQCNKKFAYRQKLLKHYEYHSYKAGKYCGYCKNSLSKTVVFHEQAGLQGHIDRRHTAPIKKIYEGDCRAIIQESTANTSLGDALQLLAGPETEAAKPNQMYRLEKGSIKISDMGEIVEIPQNIVTSTAGGAGDSNLPISVVSTDPDMIGNPNSVVQIMPVSFRNESGLPETINVVITVPPNDSSKIIGSDGTTAAAAGTTPVKSGEWGEMQRLQVTSTDWHTRAKMSAVDKELLNHCVVLDQPIHYRNQRAFIKCTECPKGMEVHFGSVTQFCEHLRKDHADKDIKPYKCDQCNYTCRVKGNLDQHIKFHSTERPFTCTMCGKGFIQKYKLNLHLKFHENRREWTCEECGSAFNDKQDLSRHKKNVHFKKEDGVSCPHCPRVFKNEYMLSQHIHVHTGERNYKCSICEKPYSTRESLRSHMKGHQFQFGCEICAKPLGSYSAFIAHKRLHDPNQSGYTCEHCGKVLLFKATLEAHIRSVHSDAKDFRCDQCEKGFKTQAQLNNHMISHTKDKPYQCQICGYAVKRKDSLRQHMYRHAEVKPYRCGRCGKEYTQKQALEIHLKSKHAGVTTFNCTLCERGFNTNYLLKKHMQKAHEVELVNKMPKSDQVIIAQQQIEEAAESEPPAPGEAGILPPVAKKQTVLINAHICEHCHEVFVSQHALAVHILSEHMNQSRVNADEDAGNVPTNEEDGQVVNISETIEIPIGEEMVLVQSVEPGVLSTALEKGATRVITNDNQTPSAASKSRTVSLLSARDGKTSDGIDDDSNIVVTDATLEDEQHSDGEEMRVIEVRGAEVEEEEAQVTEEGISVIEVSAADVEEEEVTTSVVTDVMEQVINTAP